MPTQNPPEIPWKAERMSCPWTTVFLLAPTFGLWCVYNETFRTMSRQFYSPGSADRYSAKKMAKPVNFICLAPEAQQVFLVGDFNDWHPEAAPMKKQIDGAWTTQLQLNHGHHHYCFLVDGKATLDPRAQGIARNEKNEKVSLLAVS
jgi:1,4-alpha-glucan branching enzyme